MDDFKPNSHMSKQEKTALPAERKKVEPVVKHKARVKKKSEASKLKDTFISEDANNVKSYLLMDVILPAIKNTIEDVVTNGIRMILRGDTGSRSGRSNSGRVSYRNYYDDSSPSRHSDRHYSGRKERYHYDDIVLDTRGEADDILESMTELIELYGQVSVADLYDLADLAGITGSYTDNKYGWVNLRKAEPIRVRDGYMLKLPKALPID